jgi:Reverse transcriptase (RNA-dependent DNA polymerase)
MVLMSRCSILCCSNRQFDDLVVVIFGCTKPVKSASILPVAKIYVPFMPSDFRPISVTLVLSRVRERIVVTDFIYSSLRSPLLSIPNINLLSNQLAQQLQRSSTFELSPASSTNPYVILYALYFLKAFDSVRHSTLLAKHAMLTIPDNIYNWLESFFKGHSHCTKFCGEVY